MKFPWTCAVFISNNIYSNRLKRKFSVAADSAITMHMNGNS